VKGSFPRAGSMQFIASDVVERAATIEAYCELSDPVVIGVDVARFGEDESCIRVRRGRDCRTIPPIYLRKADTMALAGRVLAEVERLSRMAWPVDMVFVDETGVGAGVVDRLKSLLGAMKVTGVNNGTKADGYDVGGEACANKGAECWARMREALRTGLAIDNDPELRAQMEGREYGYNVHNQIVLERKDDMKKRGLASPDRADAVALTYAHPVSSPQTRRPSALAKGVDYNPTER